MNNMFNSLERMDDDRAQFLWDSFRNPLWWHIKDYLGDTAETSVIYLLQITKEVRRNIIIPISISTRDRIKSLG